jgi:hypothetical protein
MSAGARVGGLATKPNTAGCYHSVNAPHPFDEPSDGVSRHALGVRYRSASSHGKCDDASRFP